jgi:hypothetical protein
MAPHVGEEVVDGAIEVVSEGHWKLFERQAASGESGSAGPQR